MKNGLKRWISFLLAVILVLGMCPQFPLPVRAVEPAENKWAGKKVSILSHSASTYAGISNNTEDNSTIGNNDIYYTEGRHGVYLKDTWWQQAIDSLGMELLVNNSWSGSCVFQPRKGEASVGYGDRAVNLHNDHTGEEPDIIWVYIGCNDFAYYKDTFGKADDVDYAALIQDNGDGTFSYAAPTTTCEAYAVMLHKVEHRYPDAEIYCMTSTARRDPDYPDNYADTGQPTEYSAELMQVAGYFCFPVIDLESCIPKEAEMFDLYMGDKRAHPNALGMDRITNAVLSVMLGADSEIRHVTSESGVVPEQAVLLGGSYSAAVELQEGYSPVVTMDGKDITATAYSNGRITVAEVTGDIEVGVKRSAKNFRWELNDDVFATVTGNGFSGNELTLLEGSITNGIFSGVKYALEDKIYLYHDQPWVMEWAITGNWDATLFANGEKGGVKGVEFLFRSNTDYELLALGEYDGTQYNNYGIPTNNLDLDMTQRHIYRLENRVSGDSNMVWLYIDGAEIGPMNNHYVGSRNDTGNTSDWISGKDFVFGYMGSIVRAINYCSLEYMEVREGGLPVEPEPLEGKTISILGASISTYTGISNNTDYNSTIGSNAVYYTAGRYGVYAEDTWWMQAANDLGLRLLVNNSWSGSSLLYERSGTVGAYVDRCVQLHNNAGEVPDIIGIQMGTNDFQYYKDTLGTADIDYDALITNNGDGTYTYATPVTSLEAAAIVLHKISVRYPDAEVYYLNISQRIDGTDELIRSFNGELKQVVEHFGAHIVDIYGSAITMEDFDTYIGDGRVHPNQLGMDAYTEAFKRALLANTRYSVDTHTVSFDLDGVTADYGDDKIVVSGDSFAVNLTAEGGKELSVTVTMGGENVTATTYADGTVSIASVTGDVTITATAADHIPRNYRWEFDGTDLVCVSGDNALTKNAGTTTDGVFSTTRYGLENAVVLSHEQPWVVEWKCEGTWKNSGTSSGGRMFTSTDVNAEYNARYIFKSATNWIIAMGEKTTSGSHNYGIALADYGIDGSELHTYRLENRIADDGSNMVWLYVDGAEIGPMNNYYVGTTSQNTTSDWLSGKDFTFPYMGTDTHGLTNCSIEYIQVWEGGLDPLPLRYDDHYDITGKTVEIIDPGTPTSYKVGYGVAEGTLDDAVVTLDGDTLVATGIGTAKVMIDGTLYEVTVTAAPISLLLLAGQSNMQGSEGNADQSIVCPEGMVYATYGDRYTMTVNNATNFAPSALTGEGSALNVNGTTTNLEDWPVDLLNEAGAGKAGPDSGYAYEWVQQTGEKVWIVNAAHGGSSITTWQDGGANYEEAVLLFSACQETLRQEIAAGHYTLSHMGYFWCQGCTDETQTAEWYVEKFLSMHEALNAALTTDIDGDGVTDTLEFANITVTLAGHVKKTGYRYHGGLYDATDSIFFMTYEELEMRGQRVAQYWLAANPDYPEINMVCNLGESWVTMPDGSDGVAEYFAAHYENGTVDYTTQVQQSASWYTPTTPKAVKDSIHYNQIGYNEVGREAARNTLILLGEIEDTDEETTVTFYDWSGYQEVSSIEAATTGKSETLVVPVVYPCYRAKEVTYQVSDGLHYDYFDLTADSYTTTGTLTAIGADGNVVSVTAGELHSYRWDLEDGILVSTGETENAATRLAGSTENGVFIDTRYSLADPFVLLHDENWILEFKMTGPWYDDASTASKKIFCEDSASATPGAMCLLVSGKNDRISVGYYGSSTHVSYGVSLSQYGISVSDTHVYRLVNHINEDGSNTIYLFVDGVQIAPMTRYFTGSGGDMGEESDYLSGKDISFGYLGTPSYPLDNGIIEYISVVETGASQDVHFHNWSDWETVTEPSVDGPGEDKRTCSGCGEAETREVEGVWQTLSLSDHMSAMPESCCAGTNLWTALAHDKYFFNGSTSWTIHSSGTVYSVTIPVSAGDRIFATSFGASGENGGSKNGIRVTWFDINGVVKTTDPAGTYAEFTANGGYLIAPEGAVAVNIPMWNNSDSNELYILNREHAYSGVSCTLCGAAHPEAADYSGKVISILSASTSTFAGYIPVADGFNLEHRARYPQDNLLTDVNETWWMQVIAELDAKLGINDSWAGSTVYWGDNMTTQNSDTGEKAAMASLTRIQNLGSNGTPDVIFFFGGGNDMGKGVTLGTFDPATAPVQVDLTATKWDTFADAYVAAIMRMQYYYPDAQIVAMVTYAMPYYVTAEKLDALAPVIEAICDHYGVYCVDLRDSGVTFDMLPDNVHPNAEGMDYITADVLDTLLNQADVDTGENVVYPVTHDLTNAGASLHYYKGVSHGASFTESISGENLTVTITMGGVDITSQVYANGTITIPNVTGALVITAKGTFDADGHLQQLPENICAGTNLWTALEPENIYYTTTGWGNTSAGTTWSITFPVEAGDRIWATSFGAYPENGSSANGVRITWFDENGLLQTVSRDVVYAEFATYGYITAPDGAVALNVPMTNNVDGYAVYILNRDHCYENGICIVCGEEHPNLANYSGKVISILGASICTFDGYIPVADGFNLEHVARYPQDNLLTDVNDTWWMQIINDLDAKLGINDSWRSTEVYNACTEEVNSSYDGTKACLSSVTRIQNLGSNGTPDVIFFFGGTNDITQRRPLGAFDPSTAPTEVDLTSDTWETVTDAYVALVMRLQYYYPDSQIVVMLPYSTRSNSDAVTANYTAVFAAICEHYGVTYVDLMDCGISTSRLPDGTHPDAEGMDYITNAVLETLLSECEMAAGENVVYSVTHDLTNAGASLHYYKGVSHGASFTESISGENLTVTVTMGGVDITESCYADGMISIDSVTGDLVIAARGIFDADGRLQQLPDSICCGTNLWTLLEHQNEYYTVNGWGNNAAGTNYSVTIPVTAGDQIWATCFGTTDVNGFAGNGVRITWFDENGVLESVTRDAVYAEFVEYGYVTAPEGAVAVNIPMASDADTWELYILNLPHNYENGLCTGCGTHLPGDINGDGEVDNKDLTRLFRHLSGYDVEVVEVALDVNGDGEVNNKDLTRLFRYLSGYAVEIH